ncbi:MAG: hypothetical protein EA366_08965 [Spirulina sp. DLM2.Bin59]|nr:MAG: hypothetical protein EA366_08965 [Spirulina sp. DLM2.Bin59]
MSLINQLKLLANGINPKTGEVLGEKSLTNRPDVIRILFALAEELSSLENGSKSKLTPEDRRQKNIMQGRPPRSHFPWSDQEKAALASEFKNNPRIKDLAELFERSPLAIAVQLQKLMLISEEELDAYRNQ